MKTHKDPHHLPASYRLFLDQIKAHVPADRIIHDPLGTLAYGTDASFYRLIPKIVIKADNETDEGKELNRRIEIILVPDLSELPSLTEEPKFTAAYLNLANLKLLQGELEDGRPAFFFHHHPLATDVTTSSGISSWIPFEVPRAEGNYPKYALSIHRDYTDPIYGILENRSEQVRAVFFGHSHLFLRDRFLGIPLFMTDSMKLPSLSNF